MLLTLNKLHKREILIYEFIDNELKTIESKNDKSYIIKKINVYISELINELLIDIENKIDNLFSIYDTKRGEEYIKILSNEEYILTYSLNMKSRLYKYVLADDTNSDIFVNNGEIVNIFDKFYTSEHIVKYCLEQLTIFYKFTEFDILNPKGWHFIKSKIDIDILKNKFRSLNFVKSENTARQNSLGKAELIELYKKTN